MVVVSFAFRPRSATLKPSTFASGSVLVAAWNIGFDPLDDRSDSIVEAIVALDADVLLLSEFTPDSALEPLLRDLRREGLAYQGKIVQKRGKQNLVFLVRNGISVANQRVWEDIQLGNNDLRPALVADIRAGQFDFRLVGVHLKSKRLNSSSNPEQKDPNRVRDDQLRLLANHITRELGTNEKDLMVIGDYNMIPDEDKAQFDMLRAVGLTFPHFWVNKEHVSYLRADGKSGSMLDGMGISPSAGEEFVKGSFQVVQLHQTLKVSKSKFRREYSDHLPIAAEFDTTVDRDP